MSNPWAGGERWIFRPSNGLVRVRRSEDLVSFVLCIAVTFLGLMLLAQALEEYHRVKGMAAWPTSLGRVLHVTLEAVEERSETHWRPFVQYMYDVNGQTVISN